jgi:hypothetical protein
MARDVNQVQKKEEKESWCRHGISCMPKNGYASSEEELECSRDMIVQAER